MRLLAFAVRDEKAEAFFQPFYLHTRGQALRQFEDDAKDPSRPVSRHPSDYVLYHIGFFDDSNGSLEPLAIIDRVAQASDFVEVKRG